MVKWAGAAGICINEESRILMVLQGKPEETKKWAVPSGGVEKGETYRECCRREFEEETGFLVEVLDEVKVKTGTYEGFSVEVRYFILKIMGGSRKIQDPDNLIYDIAWKTKEDLAALDFSFPEDRDFLLRYIEKVCNFS
ncbi:DNA mismatch repair protein MutT [Neobacillus piezotolerans]|uniref:DNA mismatch repair protein MutT n=1 Tax=Neobacillus piezotolerans TaxID=2259171 RepID=A0A3D8GUH3_9BACI|nr:NUDIX hydrolase [Neobacillus piezotolerans]RDU37696.1 DNA mismatch repair protein MutT [Neobacillus piezotolerans]